MTSGTKAHILAPSCGFGVWFVGLYGHIGCVKVGLACPKDLGDSRV